MTWRERLLGTNERYKQASLNPGEAVQGTWVGARSAWGGLPFTGGQIALSNDRVIFNPINTDGAQKILAAGARVAGVPAVGLGLRALRQTGALDPTSVPRGGVTSVQPGRDAGILHPPTVVIDSDSGRQELGIVHNAAAPNWSKRNVEARDAFLRALQGRSG